ncbi:MAG TPA: 16S rRNA (guanine(527)-N(7))-methyltransferase RsmG [Candidatus Enterenecus merdae]|nr:16S rRNA (guanine(527)-N(7))-methyltransferase RsmG [Candidatus Enterenecus merdae]
MQGLITTGLAQLGLTNRVPDNAPALLARYGHALLEQNQVMNLTAITHPQDVATLHMLDCASLLDCGLDPDGTLIDVGTGAGFPGMVLKLLAPGLSVTLLDSLQKRLDWLAGLAQDWGLSGLSVHYGRAEEAGQSPALREQFDCATARAVADLRLLSELCLPLVKVGGRFLAMKGVDCQAELDAAHSAITALGGAVAQVRDYTIPHTSVTHRVIVVDKLRPTPALYPRRWAKLRKHPL